MRFTIALMVCCLLAACGKPVKPEFDREQVILQRHFMSSAELASAAQARGLIGKERGFAVWSPSDNQCDVYLQQPKAVDDDITMTLGHEVLHCLIGQYH
ncbi:hypothetical protein LZP69_10685 [Shewanella sp. AS1]|uniref:hypothetical protein n=1 Tax=Shewanella sp. AS1 TaxID=2907626 RepID=UPI001F1F678D|nr:hypothetical protein [Shewanella sp. AS1]MCE9679626.1 hypothetical protein [Shewanella sp. AS1]